VEQVAEDVLAADAASEDEADTERRCERAARRDALARQLSLFGAPAACAERAEAGGGAVPRRTRCVGGAQQRAAAAPRSRRAPPPPRATAASAAALRALTLRPCS
jgi:hypothetical protein